MTPFIHLLKYLVDSYNDTFGNKVLTADILYGT